MAHSFFRKETMY